MGADHTAGIVTLVGLPKEAVAALSQEAQILNAVGDSSGYCQFVQATVSELRQFVQALFDRPVESRELAEMGWQCLQSEWEFNRRAGFTDADDDVPEFMKTEPIGDWSYVFDVDAATLRQVKAGMLPLAEDFYDKPIF
jgi:aldehyde:ferredoxin oxidoreductase